MNVWRKPPSFRLTIENLYATFESYPLRDDTNACPCCHNPEDEERLRRTSLRKLNPRDLEKYVTDALFVWGDENGFQALSSTDFSAGSCPWRRVCRPGSCLQ